jgi:sulfite reductase (NADPH) flavoprotein alpha-component
MSLINENVIKAPITYSKTNPYLSKIIHRKCLSKEGSSKKTFHISLSIDDTFSFKPGDSIGIYPENPICELNLLFQQLNLTQSELDPQLVEGFKRKNLCLLSSRLLSFLKEHLSDESKNELELSLQNELFVKSHDFISFTQKFPIVKPIDINRVFELLAPMAPRFYSIASSKVAFPNELHLLISTFSYNLHGRQVSGLGSSYLCNYSKVEESLIPIFILESKHFSLPEEDLPIIMIGPGTGVAPFKSFIETRVANGQTKNWLFFGERNRAFDFYYEEDFQSYQSSGFLKLSLAFSRDQEEKIYVQDLLMKEIDEFYFWMTSGAIVYVCGDAKVMAKDVQATICKIFSLKENLSAEESLEKFKEFRKTHRIIFEVY